MDDKGMIKRKFKKLVKRNKNDLFKIKNYSTSTR